jgi:hypothetical protein
MSELNSERPPRNVWIASTTHLESVSNITCVIPLYSISFIACNIANDPPSTIEHFPSLQKVPANTKLSLWSLKHHPTLVLFDSLWKPTSTLHLYQPLGGFCQWTRCCLTDERLKCKKVSYGSWTLISPSDMIFSINKKQCRGRKKNVHGLWDKIISKFVSLSISIKFV